MHTENQLPRLPGSALKVPVGWGGVEVELGCDNIINVLDNDLCCLESMPDQPKTYHPVVAALTNFNLYFPIGKEHQ